MVLNHLVDTVGRLSNDVSVSGVNNAYEKKNHAHTESTAKNATQTLLIHVFLLKIAQTSNIY